MARGRKLLQSHNSLTERQQSIVLGDLDERIVNLCLRKSTVKEAFNTFEKINKAFVRELGVLVGINADEGAMAATSSIPNIVEYNENGVMVGLQRMSLLNKGFDIDKTVIKPAKGVVHPSLYKIIQINDNGDVTLALIKNDGESEPDLSKHLKVKFSDFDMVYRVTTKAVVMHPAWPQGSPKDSSDFYNFGMKGLVMGALHQVGVNHHQEHLRVQEQPSRAVFVVEGHNFNMGTCTIPPCTTNIAVIESNGKELPKKNVVVTTSSGELRFVLTHSFDKKFCPPFWYMRDVEDREHANCELRDVSVEMRAKTLGRSAKSIFVNVPCAVNFKDVHDGTELVLHKPAVEKTKVADKDRKHKLVLDTENERKHMKRG